MAVFFAAYSEYFYSNQNMILKLLRFPHTFVKYLLSPEKLSRRLISIHDDTSIHFVKTMMYLFEHPTYRVFQELTESHIAVNEVFKIHPDLLEIKKDQNNDFVEIPVPKSHSGVRPIICRLLSAKRRKGKVSFELVSRRSKLNRIFLVYDQIPATSSGSHGLSSSLIIHAHGGGWIAQSSRLRKLCFFKNFAVDLWKRDCVLLKITFVLFDD